MIEAEQEQEEYITIDARWAQHLANALAQKSQISRINGRKFICDILDRNYTPTSAHAKTWQAVVTDITAIITKSKLTDLTAQDDLLIQAGYSSETIERFRNLS
tara:strand:+ start:343 stop:651 length:309 start_codon:yes stop_codon:yes gene_type:complete